ncbi:unnamed protein product [Pedinophyceae sp. YPF-701]|nr:unnamed protein product [Pedinophyceae sp. YPF-701]
MLRNIQLPSRAHSGPNSFRGRVGQAVAAPSRSGCATRKSTKMMPIGVPQVPYRSPKGDGWLWIDLWNCLYRERIIFLSNAVDEELGNQLVATMLYLDSENKKDMSIYINCSGGDVVPCLAIHDTMRFIKSDVATVGFGGAMGMSGFLLAMGERGKRYCLPNTRIMLHHPAGGARGQASDIHRESKELMRIRRYVTTLLAEQSGKVDYERFFYEISRARYYSAEEAQETGLIDTVVRPRNASAKAGYA